MKRLTDWMVVADAVGASARASSPTMGVPTSPLAGNDTTDGTIARPVAGSAITRGVASSR